ncbi:MAG: phosphatidylserine decarboxylase family protein [Phycisphaerales bacterium]
MRPVLGIARAGSPIVAAFVLVTAGLWAVLLWWLGAWGAIPGAVVSAVTLWCIWFFRDPERRGPPDADAILSPADGVVCHVGRVPPPVEYGVDPGAAGQMTRVSVFMNVFNVHVNRAPSVGRITRVVYRAGRFFNASLDKASEHNERCALVMERADGSPMVVVQIAGLVARRIVCRAGEGAVLARGERFGMIRFGSRVEVYLPPGAAPAVGVGDRVRAGETVIACGVAAGGTKGDGA